MRTGASPYYRSLIDLAGITPADSRTVEDLKKIPVTTKDDLKATGVKKTVAEMIREGTASRSGQSQYWT